MRSAALVLCLAACSRAPTTTAPPAPEPPPLAVDAHALLAAYERDHAAADAKYGGRALAISGIVTEVDDAYDGRTRVALGDTSYFDAGANVPDPGLSCPMGPGGATVPALRAKAHALRPGARVTIACKVGDGHPVDALGQTVWMPTPYDCRL